MCSTRWPGETASSTPVGRARQAGVQPLGVLPGRLLQLAHPDREVQAGLPAGQRQRLVQPGQLARRERPGHPPRGRGREVGDLVVLAGDQGARVRRRSRPARGRRRAGRPCRSGPRSPGRRAARSAPHHSPLAPPLAVPLSASRTDAGRRRTLPAARPDRAGRRRPARPAPPRCRPAPTRRDARCTRPARSPTACRRGSAGCGWHWARRSARPARRARPPVSPRTPARSARRSPGYGSEPDQGIHLGAR